MKVNGTWHWDGTIATIIADLVAYPYLMAILEDGITRRVIYYPGDRSPLKGESFQDAVKSSRTLDIDCTSLIETFS